VKKKKKKKEEEEEKGRGNKEENQLAHGICRIKMVLVYSPLLSSKREMIACILSI
jgi:hypothetical protein